jgi:hypothetical protein
MKDASTNDGSTAGRRSPIKRPQLSADEMRQLKWLLGGLLILFSVWTVFYLEVDAWTLMALATVAVVAGLVWPAWPARVPKRVHTLAFPFIVAFFLCDLWLKGEMLPAMVRLDILLLLYRGISYRQRRDDLQVIVLGLFLVVVAGVVTVSLTFAAQILAFTGCALAFLLVITLTDSVEVKPAVKKGWRGLITWNAPEMGRPAWAERVDWRRLARRLRAVADWRVLVLGGALFAGVVAVSALLFLAIPRFQMDNSLFLERFISKKARTGFNDSIKFGDVSEIQQDTSVALSVDVSDPKQAPATPYWRMLVLDEFREGGFRLSPALSQAVFGHERTAASVRAPAPSRLETPVSWTFYLESGVSRYLPLLGRYDQLQFREAQTFRPSAELGVVALRNEPATMTAYRVDGMDFAETLPDPIFAERWKRRGESNALAMGRSEGLLQRRLGLNATDRATLARVLSAVGKPRETLRGEGTPPRAESRMSAAEFGRAASSWLVQNHGYSLEPKIPAGSGEAIVRWTASKEVGHCELFAGAMALLAREAGFASRVVVGFKGGTWNGYSNNFTVRNSNAHAWTELWDETRGAWLRVDPLGPGTAADAADARGEAAIARRLDRSWTARLDSLQIFWYRRIVSFDERSQGEALQAVKAATENSGKRLRETLERAVGALKTWLAGPWNMRRVAGVLVVIAMGVGAGWVVKNFRFSTFNFRLGKGARKVDPVRREAGRWMVELRERNGALKEREAELVLAELERLRFGPQATWTQPEAVFRRARVALRAQKRRARQSTLKGEIF